MKTNGRISRPANELVAWSAVSHVIRVPSNAAEYDELVAILDHLLDTSDLNVEGPAAALADLIGSLIERYESKHVPELSKIRKTRKAHRLAPKRRRSTAK